MRIAIEVLCFHSHPFEQFNGPFFSLFPVIQNMMHSHGLTDGLPDCHTGVQRTVRVLKNDLHPGAHFPHFLLRQLEEIFFSIPHPAPRRILQTQDAPSEASLSAARLPYQTEGLTGEDIQRNIIYCLYP